MLEFHSSNLKKFLENRIILKSAIVYILILSVRRKDAALKLHRYR